MNNDVLVSPMWIENLIQAAESQNLKVISPALIEGPIDYDFDSFNLETTSKMKDVHRLGSKHAVCLAIHRSVWMDVGYFQPTPKLLGYEDTLFFNELKKSNIQTSITGASWLHHFGSITQTAMKQERGLSEKDGLANRYNYKLLNQSWLERKWNKYLSKNLEKKSRDREVSEHGMSIHGLRKNKQFNWQVPKQSWPGYWASAEGLCGFGKRSQKQEFGSLEFCDQNGLQVLIQIDRMNTDLARVAPEKTIRYRPAKRLFVTTTDNVR